MFSLCELELLISIDKFALASVMLQVIVAGTNKTSS
jgi:hypothetical protein